MLSLIEADSTDVHVNQATEEMLFRGRLAADDAILFLWQNRCAVVCGRNQDERAECRLGELTAARGQLARRITGGGAVYHDLGNLNFSFVVPEATYDIARQLEVIRLAVASFGIAAETSGRNDLVLADGRKFSGNAFAKEGGNWLHHGTIMVALDIAAAMRYLTPSAEKLAKHAVSSVASRIVNLRELCAELTIPALVDALCDSFGKVYGGEVERRRITARERMMRQPYISRFKSNAWLHRELGTKSSDEL